MLRFCGCCLRSCLHHIVGTVFFRRARRRLVFRFLPLEFSDGLPMLSDDLYLTLESGHTIDGIVAGLFLDSYDVLGR